MTFLQALILGLVQGLTEFFPVSSSAHLALAKWLLGISGGEKLLYFDLTCHAGTLVALIYFLRKEVVEVLGSARRMGVFVLALVPLVPAYFLLKPVRMAMADPAYLGYCLFFTGGLLLMASRPRIPSEQKTGHVVCIGIAQAMALIPGISRSGATMACARFCGWEWKRAARFSFLLAIPTILGGEVLETMKGGTAWDGWWGCYAVGFVASLGVGLVMVRGAFALYEKGKVSGFGWYCMGMGLVAWVAFHG